MGCGPTGACTGRESGSQSERAQGIHWAPSLGSNDGISSAGPAPTPRLWKPPFWLIGGLKHPLPQFHSADLHQQKMEYVLGSDLPLCQHCNGETPSGTAGVCRTSHHPSRVHPLPGTDPHPGSAVRAGFTAGRDLSPPGVRRCSAAGRKTRKRVGARERRSSRCGYTCAHKSSPTRHSPGEEI